jgi:hypothetical protein
MGSEASGVVAVAASAVNAASSSAGSVLPRAAARRKIPLAARADNPYRGLVVAYMMSDNEHSTAPLGDSEESSVKYPPGEAIPDVGQRAENDGKVSAVGRGEKPWDVLDQDPSWAKLICDPCELEEQAGAVPVEPSASAGDGEVLARSREASAEEINPRSASIGITSLCSS